MRTRLFESKGPEPQSRTPRGGEKAGVCVSRVAKPNVGRPLGESKPGTRACEEALATLPNVCAGRLHERRGKKSAGEFVL